LESPHLPHYQTAHRSRIPKPSTNTTRSYGKRRKTYLASRRDQTTGKNKNRRLHGYTGRSGTSEKTTCTKRAWILADTYDTIVFEDLQIKNMVKNHHLARSIHDASWNMLINFTTYKAEEAGGSVELVNPRNTSKQCSVCGYIQAMPLSQRTYECPDCGSVMDRDHNAAINIKNRHVPADCGELTPVETGCMSNRYESGSPVYL